MLIIIRRQPKAIKRQRTQRSVTKMKETNKKKMKQAEEHNKKIVVRMNCQWSKRPKMNNRHHHHYPLQKDNIRTTNKRLEMGLTLATTHNENKRPMTIALPTTKAVTEETCRPNKHIDTATTTNLTTWTREPRPAYIQQHTRNPVKYGDPSRPYSIAGEIRVIFRGYPILHPIARSESSDRGRFCTHAILIAL